MKNKLLNVIEFQDMFSSAKSMAIVGSSDSVLDYSNGHLIDSYDVVVRFNRVSTVGMEYAIGSKTDILVANDGNSLAKSKSADKLSNPYVVVCFVNNSGLNKTSSHRSQFLEWVNSIPLLLIPRPHISICVEKNQSKSFSMGLYALSWLPYALQIEKLLITGFTFFGALPGGGNHHTKPPSFAGALWHDADLEKEVAKQILADFSGELVVTEEIVPLLKDCKDGSITIIDKSNISVSNEVRISYTRFLREIAGFTIYKIAKIILKIGYLLRRFAEKIS